ncbi:MAG: hypothetical protein ABL971_06090 [Vicinamibacterales bacterium]
MDERPSRRSMPAAWPLVAVAVAYLTVMAVAFALSWQRNDSSFVYPIDDAYIHMAIAKNYVAHKTWGITRYEFSSSTSSPLWTVLIALTYAVFGVNAYSPLLINVLLSLGLLTLCWKALSDVLAPPAVFAALCLVLFVTPLPALSLSGMEHVLHGLITVAAMHVTAGILTSPSPKRSEAWLLLLAPLLVATRYEGLFLLAVIGALLAILKGRWRFPLVVGALGVLPITLYGWWSVSHGWLFFPNSILLKGLRPGSGLRGVVEFVTGLRAMGTFYYAPHLLVVMLGALVALVLQYRHERMPGRNAYLLMMFVASTLLHAQFAGVGWFHRYEAYLMLSGLFALAHVTTNLPPLGSRRLRLNVGALPLSVAVVALSAVLIWPLEVRARTALTTMPQATTNIYEQQCQMAKFLRTYYPSGSAAVNDIGCIAYFGDDLHILDLWGLGSLDVAKLRLTGSYATPQIRHIADRAGVKVAVVYDAWFTRFGGLPPQWIKVGEWTISNNVVAAEDTVSFYAVDPSEKDALVRHLKAFSSTLAPNVRQSGDYLR